MERNIENYLGYHINVVSHFIQNTYNQKLAEYDISMSQAKVLFFLADKGEQAQSVLQQRLYIKGSSMNGLIESLEKKELIQKRQSDEDRRTKLIQISEQGQELEKKLWVVIDHIEQELLTGFNQEEQQVIISWLKRMRENVQSCK
ncbi:MarR family winged helix-turn-helix transcriptional regulator [Pontibacillus marinus]|uniref:MarR family transcripitonal regulator n=1 Tax=Pontibacillus marinus BH030004 = DSM 16465 TaxID=1385511 RepID=A0A0A5FTF4_9BACI|nr:MarR family transcriptional regulator [Pontibacillus marinus]KGX84021.1 MarR family transcripitonal regulator [Pontibacillus marinus BH030004 = DSM 16465]